MGNIIKINTNQIKPSQDFLKERTVKFILACFSENKKDMLPPTPIVKKDSEDGSYIAIDGHNLLAVYDLLGEEIEVYVARDENDELTEEVFSNFSSESLLSRNRDLKEKYNFIEAKKDSFSELRDKYPYLKDFETAKEYYQKNREAFIREFFPELKDGFKLK